MASRRAKPRQDAGDQRIREAAAEIYRVVRPVTLDEITVLGEVQVRVNGLDEQRVEQYVEFLLAGGSFKDPIDLFEAGERLILGAGWHRREAYKRALERFEPSEDVPALAPLKAEIHTGGLEAAIEWAEEDNLAHGLELSPRDKRNILERRFKRGHEWAKLSNRALAAKLGVHHDTVAAWRREIEDVPGGNPPGARVGADGKAYDVSNIQAANQLRAAREALEKLDLLPLGPGTPEHEAASELIRWLNTSLHDFKNMVPVGSRFRAYLPYALAAELDASAPRVSYVNWMRAELPRWKEEQEQARLQEQARQMAARDFATIDDLRARILEVLFDGEPKRAIELAAALGEPDPKLYRMAREQLKAEGLIIEDAPPGGRLSFRLLKPAEPSDNRYQIDELSGNSLQIDTSEPADDWLERPAVKGPALVGDIDEALQRGEPVAHQHDEDLAEKLSTLLRVGDMVAGHLEMVLERTEPIPDWLLIKLNELQGLLYGRAGRDADIYDPGLTQLLDDLYTKHTREKEQ